MSATAGSQRAVWLAVASVPIVWAAQGLVGWAVAARSCGRGDAAAVTARTVVVATTVVALLLSAWAFHTGRAQPDAPGATDVVHERRTFVAFAAAFVAAMLGIGVLWAGLPALLVRTCGEIR